MWVWIWLAITALALIIEFVTMELVSIWFVAGGLIALILTACGVSYVVNVIVFIVISFVMLFSFRKLALKVLNKNNNEKTNVDEFIGKTFKLLTEITESTPGTIKIHGVIWNVVTEDDSSIEKDNYVTIVRVKGNKFIVKKGEK